MKTMGKSIESFVAKAKGFCQRVCLAVSSCALIFANSQIAAYADGGRQGSDDIKQIVNACIEIVVDIFPFVGAFFVIAGVFKLILAYRNDQPEAQAGAAKDIVIGAVFIAFKLFVWGSLSDFIVGK